MSAGFNQVIIFGQLSDIPEEFKTKNDKLFIKAKITVLMHRKNADGTSENAKYVIVATMFSGAAELFLKCVRVGDMVHLVGKLDSIERVRPGGKKYWSLNFVAEHICLLPRAEWRQ